MALSTTVFQRRPTKRKAPRAFLRGVFKKQKPHLRLEACSDLLKNPGLMLVRKSVESLARIMFWLQQR
ncbi:centromere protein W isoform X2 [Perognathus longimembris pacificus]|uniref:centromere protein W isoform X2 n=1 Tax=Perognathus longimembris pacificus TaxID=214514 RepID=UPI0020193996|nr:centromere protein W isoform X2 [Perognathus longimembris pacificus]